MTPRTYVVGLPVIITVHDDGTVEYEIDKGEAAESIAETYPSIDALPPVSQETVDADVERVQAALTAVAAEKPAAVTARRLPPASCLAGRHRPDDDPEPGNRCKDCGHGLSWLGPTQSDWECEDCPVLDLDEGDRVRFLRAVDRYPHAAIEAGETGTVITATWDLVAIRPDDPRDTLTEWDGCIEWYPTETDTDTALAALVQDVERIS